MIKYLKRFTKQNILFAFIIEGYIIFKIYYESIIKKFQNHFVKIQAFSYCADGQKSQSC